MQQQHLTKTALIGALAFCLAPAGIAQSPSGTAAPAVPTSQSAGTSPPSASENESISPWQGGSGQSGYETLDELRGRTVVGPAGEELGRVNDFLLDARSGEIAGVVVSTGGVLGVGDRLRVVSGDRLQKPAGGENLRLSLDRTAFEALAVASDEQVNRGTVALMHPRAQTSSAATPGDRTSASSSGSLVRASKLEGKDLRAAGEPAGDIAEIAIHLGDGRAAAIVETEDDFAGRGGKFSVPFGKLGIAESNQGDTLTVSFSRADFAAGSSTGSAVATAPARAGEPAETSSTVEAGTRSRDENLAPTGRASGDRAPTDNAALADAARSIRTALDNDATLAREEVRVTPGNDRIVLKGSVRSENAKSRVEKLARDAANSATIENQIEVRDQ